MSGEWRVLTGKLMYRIRELRVLQNEAHRIIGGVGEYNHPPCYTDYFHERKYQYARLGMKALISAMRLRRTVDLPKTRLADTEWSVHPILWKIWRRERRCRAKVFLERKRKYAKWEVQDALRDVQPEAGK